MGMEDDIHLRMALSLSLTLAGLKVEARGGVRVLSLLWARNSSLFPMGGWSLLTVILHAMLLHLALLVSSSQHLGV